MQVYVAILNITVYSHANLAAPSIFAESVDFGDCVPPPGSQTHNYGNKAKHRDFPKPVGSDTNTLLPSTKALTASFCSVFNDS